MHWCCRGPLGSESGDLAPSDGCDVNHSPREQSAGTPHVQLTWRERLPDASDDDVAEPEITVTLERPDCASFKMVGTHVRALRMPCKPRRPKLKVLLMTSWGRRYPASARLCSATAAATTCFSGEPEPGSRRSTPCLIAGRLSSGAQPLTPAVCAGRRRAIARQTRSMQRRSPLS